MLKYVDWKISVYYDEFMTLLSYLWCCWHWIIWM